MGDNIVCNINFNSPTDSYYSGQTVFGNVDIEIRETISVKKLVLQIRALAKYKKKQGRRTTTANHSILFSVLNLLPNRNELLKGNHKYDFNFALPPQIPSSASGEMGRSGYMTYEVRYEAVVFFIRSWKLDLKYEKKFYVISGLDLNLHPQLQAPMTLENNEMIAKIDRLGYVAGEVITVNVQMKIENENKSEEILCTLDKLVAYENSPNFLTNLITESETIHERTTKIYSGQRDYAVFLKIPECTTSTADPNMKVINILYRLSVARPKKISLFNKTLEFPITIGLVPLAKS